MNARDPILLICLVAMLIAAPLSAQEATTSSPTQPTLSEEEAAVIRDAEQAIRAGGGARALAGLNRLAEQYPLFADLHRLRGHAALAADEIAQARDAFQRDLLLAGPRLESLQALLTLERDAGRHDRVIDHLYSLIDLQPDAATWPLLLIETLRETNRLEEARRQAERLTRRDPAQARGWVVLARIEIDAANHPAAVRHLTSAWWLGEQTIDLARMIGDLHYRLEDHVTALIWYARARALMPEGDPQHLEIMKRQIAAAYAAQRWPDVEQWANELRQLPDQSAIAHLWLARIAQRQNQTDRAVTHFQQAWTGRRDPAIARFLAAHFLQSEEPARAMVWLDRLHRLTPEDQAWAQQRIDTLHQLRDEALANALTTYIADFGLDDYARSRLAWLVRE